jgi:alkylhydroperoxidase/carboxymuconolactone decarboxylase family protein YurZ
MALLTAPAADLRSAPPERPVSRIAARARSTPGRFALLMALLSVLGMLAGVAVVVGLVQRAAKVDAVSTRSGPLTVQAQQLYRSLSDADATAASAFLSNGVEPAALRDRYQSDLAAASAALAAVTAGSDTSGADIGRLTAQLPVYAGLVETARTYNRLGRPLGAAYLREASGLMRTELLPAAQRLYSGETAALRDDRWGGAGFPWLAMPLLVITLLGLVWAQRHVSRRTRRLVNLGLLAATGATLLMLAWVTLSWAVVRAHLDAAERAGSAQVEVLAQARTAALQARADEALTLVARGSGGDFDKDFDKSMNTLAGDGLGGLLALARQQAGDPKVRGAVVAAQDHVKDWRAAHKQLRDKDNGGDYLSAVTMAIGADQGSAASAFTKLDNDLASAITEANGAFGREARAAGQGLTGAVPGSVVLTLLLLAGVVAGLQQRIAEYR